jgi:hypothetical protein
MRRKIWLPIFVILAMMFGACSINVDLDLEQGSGNVVTETRPVSGFDKVLLNGIGDVTLVQGDVESLEIEAEDNVIEQISTEVKDNTLEIRFDKKTVIPTKSVKFRLTMPNIHSLETQGVSNIQSDQITTDHLQISISGTGNVDIDHLNAEQLTINISGAGNLTARGKVREEKVSLSGAGNFTGDDLETQTARITISGLGRVTAWVTEQLDVTISGTGGVEYYGTPQISQQISGLGNLRHLGNK